MKLVISYNEYSLTDNGELSSESTEISREVVFEGPESSEEFRPENLQNRLTSLSNDNAKARALANSVNKTQPGQKVLIKKMLTE